MAKSARSSVTKNNNRKLRKTIFGPAHAARTARLSAKLQELAAKPKPETEKAMDVDDKSEEGADKQMSSDNTEEMDLDALGATIKPSKSASGKNRVKSKVRRVPKRLKPRNNMIFPAEVARRRNMATKKTKR